MRLTELWIEAGIQTPHPLRDARFSIECPGCQREQNLEQSAFSEDRGRSVYRCVDCEQDLVFVESDYAGPTGPGATPYFLLPKVAFAAIAPLRLTTTAPGDPVEVLILQAAPLAFAGRPPA